MKMDGDWSEVGLEFPWVAFEEITFEGLRRYNIAPTDEVVVVTEESEPIRMRWGLVKWAKALKSRPLINARAETVATQSAFKHSFQNRRCLIPVNGFYEWTQEMGKKQPYLFTRSGKDEGGLLAMAGLHARWQPPEGDEIRSCTVITAEARGEIVYFHERMPAILPRESFREWLSPETSEERLHQLLEQRVTDLEARKVSTRVNYVKNDDPECCAPPAEGAPPNRGDQD